MFDALNEAKQLNHCSSPPIVKGLANETTVGQSSSNKKPYSDVVTDSMPLAIAPMCQPILNAAPPAQAMNFTKEDCKFNIIIYGIDECPEGSSRSSRQSQDLDNAISVINTLDNSIDAQSVKDFFRLGRFKVDCSRLRPITVKFIRSVDATSVISKAGSLKRPYFIKPDMSLAQRSRDASLLKVR